MRDTGDIQVVSSYGAVVTYDEHCKRLAEYLEEIKREAVGLTNANASLTSYILQLKLVFGGLLLKEEQYYCYYYIKSKRRIRTVPLKDNWTSRKPLDENGHPILSFDFFSIKESIRHHIVHEFFLPQLTRNTKYFREFIKKALESDLGWKYISSEKREKCLEMTFYHKEIDIFWFILHTEIKVLIGTYADIENCLTHYKHRYLEGNLFIIDIEYGTPKPDETYTDLLADFRKVFPEQKHHIWTYWGIGHWFNSRFRALASSLDNVLKIGMRETYLLGELLTEASDYQDELIQELRKLPAGENRPHEELVYKILDFCFKGEFRNFKIHIQHSTHHGARIRDFIIDNDGAKEEFWRDMKLREEIKLREGITISRGVELILFDAKNYEEEISFTEISETVHEYLVNRRFGNFIIIICRKGIRESDPQRYDHLLADGKVVLSLNDDDLIKMINQKREGKSPTSLIAQKYYDFIKTK